MVVIVVLILVIGLSFLLWWAVNRISDKGHDAIMHKLNAKKNADLSGRVYYLADLYRHLGFQAPNRASGSLSTTGTSGQAEAQLEAQTEERTPSQAAQVPPAAASGTENQTEMAASESPVPPAARESGIESAVPPVSHEKQVPPAARESGIESAVPPVSPDAPVSPIVQTSELRSGVQPPVSPAAAPEPVIQPGVQSPVCPAVPAAKFCTGCGNRLPDNSRFCPKCGKKVSRIQNNP